MINQSILTAFQRMWQHIVVALNNKSDKDHSHTVDSIGAMSAENPVGTGSFSLNRKTGSEVGEKSFAEGYLATASGWYSHAEGYRTTASESSAHAEGTFTMASGGSAHAEGSGSIAGGENQHVQGKYNVEDATSAHIVGNGTDENVRSNAHTLDWSGNAWFAGDVYVGSTSGVNKDGGSKKLVTADTLMSKYVFRVTDPTTYEIAYDENQVAYFTTGSGGYKRSYSVYRNLYLDDNHNIQGASSSTSSLTIPSNTYVMIGGNLYKPDGVYESIGDDEGEQWKYECYLVVVKEIEGNTQYVVVDEDNYTNESATVERLGMVGDVLHTASTIPPYTSADEGKFLRIVNSVPTWATVDNAEGVEF